MLETILLSMGAIALSEIGDKTQLLALALAAHYRKPIPIVLGILCATLLNHWLAAMLGYWINAWLTPEILRWVLIVSFIGMGIWMMIPDKDDSDAEHSRWKKYGVFTATLILFFLAEMGDKTQLATIAIAAKVGTVISVMMGTTVGMLLADAPVVFIGDRFAKYIPVRTVHIVAALVFIGFGVAAYFADPSSFVPHVPAP